MIALASDLQSEISCSVSAVIVAARVSSDCTSCVTFPHSSVSEADVKHEDVSPSLLQNYLSSSDDVSTSSPAVNMSVKTLRVGFKALLLISLRARRL